MQIFMPKYTVDTLRAIFSHPPIFSFYWTSIHCKIGNQIGSTNGCCYFSMPCCSHLYHLHTFDVERAWGLEVLLRNSPLMKVSGLYLGCFPRSNVKTSANVWYSKILCPWLKYFHYSLLLFVLFALRSAIKINVFLKCFKLHFAFSSHWIILLSRDQENSC